MPCIQRDFMTENIIRKLYCTGLKIIMLNLKMKNPKVNHVQGFQYKKNTFWRILLVKNKERSPKELCTYMGDIFPSYCCLMSVKNHSLRNTSRMHTVAKYLEFTLFFTRNQLSGFQPACFLIFRQIQSPIFRKFTDLQ